MSCWTININRNKKPTSKNKPDRTLSEMARGAPDFLYPQVKFLAKLVSQLQITTIRHFLNNCKAKTRKLCANRLGIVKKLLYNIELR